MAASPKRLFQALRVAWLRYGLPLAKRRANVLSATQRTV